MKEIKETSGVMRVARLQMPLQSDGMQRYAGLLQLVDQLQQTAAYREADIVVPFGLRFVENQFGLLVDLPTRSKARRT